MIIIGNFKRETESLLIAAQNNAIRTNHIKARIDKTQQNSKCRLWGDRDETINHIRFECSKSARKDYKTRYYWVGKFKFDHTNKWYIHNPPSVLENDTHELLLDIDIHTDHLISARRPDLIIINKKKKRICKIVDIAVPADHRIKVKECEKKISTSTLLENWKAVEHEGDDCTNCNWRFWHINLRIIKGTGGHGSWWTRGDHPNDSIIENGQNTEKSPGHLRRLAVTKTPVENH